MSDFITELRKVFEEHANLDKAATHKAYLKDHFECLGIKTPVRREITQPFLTRAFLPTKDEAIEIVKECWQQPERDFHQFGIDFFKKYSKKLEEKDMPLLEYLITHNSWWDSVDVLAVHMVGAYFKKFPQHQEKFVKKWCEQENMWLRRTAIIYQLKYKKETDLNLLTYSIENNLNSKEFFINKAIGWALRDYSRINGKWVMTFVDDHPELNNLSKREALRLILDK